MNSFGLLKTNVLLTSNVKVIVDSISNIFLESIESDPYLSLNKLKKFKYNYSVSFGKNLSLFYKDLPNDTIFRIKKDDLSLVFDDYNLQNNELYECGAKNISNNKDYVEKYEYFAPLYLKDKLPTNFIIFRVDGVRYDSFDKLDFKSSIINKFKVVKNISFQDNINNILNNDFHKYHPIEINLTEGDLSYWYGIDTKSGVFTKKSFNLYEYLKSEKEIYELEKFITNKFMESDLIYPKIINFSFLFNDNPSTPDQIREWSINNYYGFYVDELIKIDTITTYIPRKLKNDVKIIDNNYILSESNSYPFMDKWDETIPFYIEYLGELLLVKKVVVIDNNLEIQNSSKNDFLKEEYGYKSIEYYQIISDKDLKDKESFLNKKVIKIQSDGVILNIDNSSYNINKDDHDVTIIEIDSNYYSIIYDGTNYKINSDFAFEFYDNYYRIKKAGEWHRRDVIIDFDKKPLSFDIFKVRFSDIKYFDNRIVNTDISNFEYEIKDTLSKTQESKFYMENFNDISIPKNLDQFRYNGEIINIPVSSEYSSNLETFKIDNNKLSDIWQPNSNYCRWGYINSINSYDYPYIFNNSLLLEDFNKASTLNISIPMRSERNLDYFYTLNSNKNKYYFNSLDINKDSFNLIEYINSDSDYFSDFFEGVELYDNNRLKKYKKYSNVLKSDNVITNNTLFRGIKFNIFKSIKNNEVRITNDLFDYKFSILLDKKKDSKLRWDILKEWNLNKSYKKDDKVIFNDTIYVCSKDTIQNSPVINKDNIEVKALPYNLSDWISLNEKTILWTPSSSVIYNIDDIVFNNGIYYVLKNIGSSVDFWNPYIEYKKDDRVLYKNKYYNSQIDNNIFSPEHGGGFDKSDNLAKFWKVVTNVTDNDKIWHEISVWSSDKKYKSGVYVFHENVIYLSNSDMDINLSPSVNRRWVRYYSLNSSYDFIYKENNNRILFINNHYYYLVSNEDNEVLDNGIEIYINKKWKNILVYIHNSDNTLPDISNVERDVMYNMLYKNIISFNFINCINDIKSNYGFYNTLKYTIVEDDNTILTYDSSTINNYNNIYVLIVEFPKRIDMNPNPIKKTIYSRIPSLVVKNKLIENKINSINQVDWYSNIPIAYSFENPTENINDLPSNIIYRYSGLYEPVFLNVELFDNNNLKFNIDLYDFGILKEKKLLRVNKNEIVLKLSNRTDSLSIYPMVDEFGVTFIDWDIFKSPYSNDFIYISKK